MPTRITGARRIAGARVGTVWCAIAIITLAALLVSCGADADSDEGQVADAYVVVIEWVLADDDHTPRPLADELALIFVESIGPADIDLDVQISVVGHFEEKAEIRFIDDRSEAVDEEAEGAPVRNRGVLLGLGAVSEDGSEMDIRGEIYQTTASVVGYRFRLDDRSRGPVMVEPPEQVEPEGLVAGQ